MTRVHVITGGPTYAHDFTGSEGTGTALATMIAEAGHDVLCTDDVEAGLLASGDADVVVINALRWRMLADRYRPWRDEWAYSPSAEARRAMFEFVRTGGGLIASHTAVICFDDWHEWGDLLGGSWVWEVSSHPAPQPVAARLSASHHPVLQGVSALELVDEVYGDLRIGDDVTVLATAQRYEGDDDQPVVWTHSLGAGRVVVDGFGHDAASLQSPEHRRLLLNAVAWCAHHRGPVAS